MISLTNASEETCCMLWDELTDGPSDRVGLSTRRALSQADLERFARLVMGNEGRRVTVYSGQGFVANSYGWRCEIESIRYEPCYPHGRITRHWGCATRCRGMQDTERVW